MVKVICVSGSVCSGKTTLAKELAEMLDFEYINVNKIIDENKEVISDTDVERDTKEIDVEKLNKVLIKLIKNSKTNLIIDSHLSHYLPKEVVNVCIIIKCDLKVLKQRLIERDYNDLKIKENLEAEIFDSCLFDALEGGHTVLLVDSSQDIDFNLILNQVKGKL